jgi:hypothetical protein
MKFLYRYIYRLIEPEIIATDIDPAMLGNILHEIMKNLYQPFVGKVLTAGILEGMIKDRQFLSITIAQGVNEKYKSGRDDSISGSELIVRDVLMTYLYRILNADKNLAPVGILNLEDTFDFPFSFSSRGSEIEIITGGKVDRIDNVSGVSRIVDYKTGTVSESVSSISDLFTDDRKKDADGWLQTLLYCEAYLSANPCNVVRPSVYKIRKLNSSLLSDKLKLKTGSRSETEIEDYGTVREEFLRGLKGLISTMFAEDEPFIKTADARGKCSYCPYKTLCMR